MNILRKSLLALVLVSTVVGIGGIQSAFAYHGDWHRGHWVHDRHGGRLGWWWVVGPSWNFYERPYIAQPPQTVIIQQAPPPQVVMQQAPPPQPMAAPAPAPVLVQPVLYYCKATGTHYPETMSCPGGWTTMTATTPPEQ